jgi:predicted ester cyclase
LSQPCCGKRVRVTFMNLDRFAGGKLVEHRAQVDRSGLLQQLGVVPS